MPWRPHPRRAETNPRAPRAWATCQRCGFVANLYKFNDQVEWRGTQLQSLHIYVCSDCYDTPQRQLGTVILPPDPMPVLNALPEPYPIDEQWPRLLQNGGPRYLERSRKARVLEWYNAYENV